MRMWSLSAFLACCLYVGHLAAQTAPEAPEAAELELDTEESSDPVEAQLAAMLDQIPELSEVTTAHGAGVVTLTGTVARAEHRATAGTLAGKVDGVMWVDNRVRVEEEVAPTAEDDPTAADAAIRERLESIFANVTDLRDVEVTVRAGVVRLEGTVLSPEPREKAEALAKTLDGVVYVDNDLAEERAVKERISPALERAREVLEDFIATLPLFAVAILIFTVFGFVARLVSQSQFLFRRLDDRALVQGIARQVTRIIIVGAGVILILELFNLTALVSAVLGTAGVAGLALGFAFRDIVENYLASLMLSFRQPFAKNDFVRIDQHEGKVVRLSTRETVLMTLDGNHLRLPNALVFKSVILNFSRNPLRRIDFTVGVSATEDLVETMQVGLDTLKETRGVLGDPCPFVVIERLGDFAVEIHFYAWVDQRETDLLGAKSAAIRRILEAFTAAEVDIPEPTTRVLVRPWESSERPDAPRPPRRIDGDSFIEPEAPTTDQLDAQIAEEDAASDEKDLLK